MTTEPRDPDGGIVEAMLLEEESWKWTTERRRLSAMAHLAVESVRSGDLSAEEALTLTIFPPEREGLDERLDEVAAMLERRDAGRPGWTPEQAERQSERRKRLYREDPAYRERELARKRASR